VSAAVGSIVGTGIFPKHNPVTSMGITHTLNSAHQQKDHCPEADIGKISAFFTGLIQ
jgi:hypothetical protein